jgi:hypothetical protein
MGAMSSNGGWDTVFRLFAIIPQTREEPVTPQQPTLLRAAANFSTMLEKWLEDFSTAVCAVAREGGEALRVHNELVEYHGGEDQGADIYVLALSYLGQKPDADLEARLRRLMDQYGDQLELQRMWKLLDRHRSRVHRSAVAERALAVRRKIRLVGHEDLRVACEVLASGSGVSLEQLLIGEIQETLCAEGAFLLHDQEIVRETTSRIKREATRRKKEPQTVTGVRESFGLEDPDFESLRILMFLRQTEERAHAQKSPPSQQELQSLAACAYMPQKEAGVMLGRSKDQVKTERRRALDKLRKATSL